jgi:putative hydrolase of the HAD superfamily
MNVIFDIGKVLIDFDFEGYARRILGDEEVSQNVIDAMWNSGDWNELDRGVLSDEEVLGRFIAHAPQYEREIRLVFSKIAQCPGKRESTIPIIQTLKGLGHGVYFLSNYFYFLLHSAPEALDFTEYILFC